MAEVVGSIQGRFHREMAAGVAEPGRMGGNLPHGSGRGGLPPAGIAEPKVDRGHLQHGQTHTEQKEAISKSLSAFDCFTNNPLSSHTSLANLISKSV